MEEIDLINEKTCRFCHDIITSPTLGAQVCDCRAGHGANYGHYSCFNQYVKTTGRITCQHCKQPWRINVSQVSKFALRYRRVSIMNRVREAASYILSLVVLLACVLVVAYLVKVLVWIFTGTPAYTPFNQPILHVSGWLRPAPGDVVVGLLGTGLALVTAGIVIAFKARGYNCCIRTRVGARRLDTYPDQYDLSEDYDDHIIPMDLRPPPPPSLPQRTPSAMLVHTDDDTTSGSDHLSDDEETTMLA